MLLLEFFNLVVPKAGAAYAPLSPLSVAASYLCVSHNPQ